MEWIYPGLKYSSNANMIARRACSTSPAQISNMLLAIVGDTEVFQLSPSDSSRAQFEFKEEEYLLKKMIEMILLAAETV